MKLKSYLTTLIIYTVTLRIIPVPKWELGVEKATDQITDYRAAAEPCELADCGMGLARESTLIILFPMSISIGGIEKAPLAVQVYIYILACTIFQFMSPMELKLED